MLRNALLPRKLLLFTNIHSTFLKNTTILCDYSELLKSHIRVWRYLITTIVAALVV